MWLCALLAFVLAVGSIFVPDVFAKAVFFLAIVAFACTSQLIQAIDRHAKSRSNP